MLSKLQRLFKKLFTKYNSKAPWIDKKMVRQFHKTICTVVRKCLNYELNFITLAPGLILKIILKVYQQKMTKFDKMK